MFIILRYVLNLFSSITLSLTALACSLVDIFAYKDINPSVPLPLFTNSLYLSWLICKS